MAGVVLGLALLGGACSSSSDDSGDASSAGGDTLADGDGANAAGGSGGDDAGGGGGGAAEEVAAGPEDLEAQAPPEQAPERIIYTSDVRVRVDEPADAAADAIALAEGVGGSLAAQTEQEGEDVVTVTLRVPVEEFRPALDAVAGLGEVLDRHVEAEDVSDQVVDLEGRLENARASADRLRELYATAEGVDQIVSIEQALTQREAEVESLSGQLRQLEDRAARSTITATFVDEGEPVVADDEEDVERTGFVGGLRTGRDVIVAVGAVVATIAGFLVPFLPLLLVAGLVLLVVRRISRRRTGETADLTPAAANSGE
ncbi:MAG TPA: DUF4349 domain-containing protein [Iamia sp.]